MKYLKRFFESNWSEEVDTDFKPKEDTFTRHDGESDKDMSDRIAKYLKANSDDLKQAMSRINFYINRGGENISETDKSALETVKNKLRKLFK